MAKMVLKAAYLSINSTDLSSYLSKIELTAEVEEQDMTTFASAGWKEVAGGLASAGLKATYKNDHAAAAIDSVLWPLFGTVVPFEVRSSSAVVGANNPKWTGNVLIKNYVAISGGVGDADEGEMDYPTSGAVARAVA